MIKSSFFSVLMLLSLTAAARGQDRFRVDLRFNLAYEQRPFTAWIDFSGEDASIEKSGRAPGQVAATKTSIPGQNDVYSIKVDTNGDGSMSDEENHLLHLDSTITVRVQKAWSSGRTETLPYLIAYHRRTNREGEEIEIFSWRPHYRAEGTLHYGTCQSLIALLDIDGNGLFDAQDFLRGTTVNLDVNGDGTIWGKKEWLRGDQIIEFCGSRFLIDEIAEDGSYVLLKETPLPVPKLGEPVPSFTAQTMEGKSISSADLEGTNYLLDFWASWCSPCVGKFPYLQELEQALQGQVKIIAVNVDEPSDLEAARAVVVEYDLSWPHIMTGKGASDPLWKMFGSMADNRLSIPLYVLVDRQSRVYYAANGGDDLGELAAAIESMLAEQVKEAK